MLKNFCNMSGMYIPELVELDSYWKKAVEDAICDKIKGEKRLYYALRNRKKIKEKLIKLGLKKSSSREEKSRNNSSKGKSFYKCRSPSSSGWESYDDKSSASVRIVLEKKSCASKEQPKASQKTHGSRSKSRGHSQEKRFQNPEGPFLGDGSHEKIKKSQNSFNYEPMGSGSTVLLSESEGQLSKPDVRDSKKKEIEWLHVRDGAAFKDSDTEMSNAEGCREVADKKEFERGSTIRDLNYFMKNKAQSSRSSKAKRVRRIRGLPKVDTQNVPLQFDLQEDLFWENEVKNAIRENVNLERKLCLALAKRQILSKGTRRANNKIQIQGALPYRTNKRKKPKNLLSPFVKFYLEVYRELYRKHPIKEIPEEAVARWRIMPMELKMKYNGKIFSK